MGLTASHGHACVNGSSSSSSSSHVASNVTRFDAGSFSTSEVAELIGLNADQVRHYVRRKLIQPARGERDEFRFSFQDVVLLRTAKSLMDASVSTRKAYRALVKLKSELQTSGFTVVGAHLCRWEHCRGARR